jgi:RNA polymerase sigma-70 factor (ECF subfamily)
MEPDSADDASLLHAHAAGDPHAFARLYDRYDRPCFRFIRRTLAAHADAADDLHQETWIAVSRNAAAFDPKKASFPAWLFAVARNKVWDHLRRQKVAVLAQVEDNAAMTTVPDPGPTPLEQAASRELAQRIIDAVEALPLAQRETFVMFAHAGLSLEDVAQATGVPLETAKSRLRYARATLRQALADERPAHA